MKVIDKSSPYSNDEILEVYGIYFIYGEYYYLCSPRLYDGLLSFKEKNVEIFDNILADKFYYKRDANDWYLFHWAIYENDLYDNLSEYDPDAYAEFVRRLGREP